MLGREEVSAGIVAELGGFEALLRTIDDNGWTRPTRCEGWTVADVAAHLTGSMSEIVAGKVEGQGSPEVTARQVEERRGRTAGEIADELAGTAKASKDMLALFDDAAWAAPAPGDFQGTLGDGVEALWADTYIHAEDIRAALGRPSVTGPGLRCAISHVAHDLTQRGWGPATLALDGMAEVAVGTGTGKGRRITAAPLEFVLVATGRADPARIGLDPSVNIYA
jgi:uncharacterized protein (TIGR03083 family)